MALKDLARNSGQPAAARAQPAGATLESRRRQLCKPRAPQRDRPPRLAAEQAPAAADAAPSASKRQLRSAERSKAHHRRLHAEERLKILVTRAMKRSRFEQRWHVMREWFKHRPRTFKPALRSYDACGNRQPTAMDSAPEEVSTSATRAMLALEVQLLKPKEFSPGLQMAEVERAWAHAACPVAATDPCSRQGSRPPPRGGSPSPSSKAWGKRRAHPP